jgi:hypothetical protein
MLGVFNRLPGGGQDVGEEQVAIVGRSLGHLDRPVVGLGNAQELGLAAGDLAVQLGVAEQRGAHPLVAYLGRFALRLQALLAHEAVAAGDVERHDHAIADAQMLGRLEPHFLDDAHGLVAEDVALFEEGSEDLVEMQVRAAQAARRDADDRVSGLFDRRIGDRVNADVAPSMPRECLHDGARYPKATGATRGLASMNTRA